MRCIVVGSLLLTLVGGTIAQQCDTIRIEGSKYFCGEYRLKTKTDFQNALATNQEALAAYNSARGLSMGANAVACIGGSLLGWGLGANFNEQNPTHENAGTFMAVGGGIAVVGIGMSIGAAGKFKKAVRLYNSKSTGPVSSISFQVHPARAALTFALR
jgi:hypothetical protein